MGGRWFQGKVNDISMSPGLCYSCDSTLMLTKWLLQCQASHLYTRSFKAWSGSESEVAQSCPTLCNPVDCSPPGSSVHGILQARILEWVAISFSRGSSWPRDRTQVSCIAGRRFNLWATREAQDGIKQGLKPPSSICVEYLSPALHFQSVCVPCFDVGLL